LFTDFFNFSTFSLYHHCISSVKVNMTTIYGCTAGCTGTFETIRDWRRHEYNHHYFYECWLCTENDCLRLFYKRSHYEIHIITMHGVERDVESHHIGAGVSRRFWCGFCKQIIELQTVGMEAWEERLRHFEAHFEGRDGMGLGYGDYMHIYLRRA
jgi:hypothetical protein